MEDIFDKIRGAVAAGLSQKETEAMLGHTLSKDESNEFMKVKAQLKIKSAIDKHKPQHQSTATAMQDYTRLPSIRERYTKKEVEDTIVRCNGRWTPICAALNCSYRQLQVWMEHHKEHAELAKKLRESIVDAAEEELYNLLESSDPVVKKDVAKFILQTLGKDRGWGKDQVLTQTITSKDSTVEIKSIFGLS